MENKESFVFYKSFFEAISLCPEELQLELYKSIANYALSNIEPDFSNNTSLLVWKLIKPQLDANNKRFVNGCKGGAPKGNKNNPNGRRGKTNITNQEPTENQPNVNDNDNDNDNDNVNDNVNESKKSDNSLSHTHDNCDKKLFEWLQTNAPYISKNFTHLITSEELTELKEKYPLSRIYETILELENRKDLRKKYENLYRTLLNWLRCDNVEKSKQYDRRRGSDVEATSAEDFKRAF
jgi:hypothetical protein